MKAFHKTLIVSLALIAIVVGIISNHFANSVQNDKDTGELRALCQDYAKNYTLISESEDHFVIEVKAPDFVAAVTAQVKNNPSKKQDTKTIIKAIKDDAPRQKGYILTVNELSDEAIEKPLSKKLPVN